MNIFSKSVQERHSSFKKKNWFVYLKGRMAERTMREKEEGERSFRVLVHSLTGYNNQG